MSGDTPPAEPPKEAPSALSQLPETLLTRTLELCRLARAAQLGVTPGRVIDVARSLRSIQFVNEDDFRLALRRRVRSVVWINPMYGAASFEPRAQGMKAALPYIDHFLPAYNAQSLQVLVRELARV